MRKFDGVMIMRPFGLSTGMSYENIVAQELGVSFFTELQKVQNRFWFGQGYAHLNKVEEGIFKQRAITLPVGLASSEYKDTWKGNKKRIYFVCPRISTSPFYHYYYEAFKDQFEDKYDYIIGGAQPLPVKDSKVAGYLSNEEYQNLFIESRLMFYHSQDRNHLHYHPFEAVKCGLPLIFMANGMLDELGYGKLPGCAHNQPSLHKKVARIMGNDRGFIKEVRKSQIELLDVVKAEHCLPVWRTSMKIIEDAMEAYVEDKPQKKKILFCLPYAFGGGTLSSTKQIVKMFSKAFSDQWEVYFTHLKADYYNEETLGDLTALGIKTREFQWQKLENKQMELFRQLRYLPHLDERDDYVLMTDGENPVSDYDHVFFTTDRIPGVFANDIPYSMLIQDVLQRYVPEFMAEYFETEIFTNARNAMAVYTTTPDTLTDIVDYIGTKPSKVKLLPLTFDNDLGNVREKNNVSQKYFVWPTNLAVHKNHLKMLSALEYYWNELDGKLDCYMTGVETGKLTKIRLNSSNIQKKSKNSEDQDKNSEDQDKKEQVHPYHRSIVEKIKSNPVFSQRLKIKGEMGKSEYATALAGAQFLVHPVIADNCTFCAIEAASVGVPTLSNDYPQMRYIDKLFALDITFGEAQRVRSFAKSLKAMEQSKASWQTNSLPSVKAESRAWDKMWPEFRNAVTDLFEQ